jgi:hypothetical protein
MILMPSCCSIYYADLHMNMISLLKLCLVMHVQLEIGKEAQTLGQRQNRFTENDHHGWGAFTAPGVSKEKSISSKQDQLSSQLGALVKEHRSLTLLLHLIFSLSVSTVAHPDSSNFSTSSPSCAFWDC